MTPRACPRCHSTLHSEDATSLIFCWHCGAPQVTLSEELQERFAQQQVAGAENGSAPLPPAAMSDAAGVVWPRVIQLAGLAGAVVVVLSIVTAAFEDAAMLTFFWAVGAPIILLGIYCARTPLTRITTGFGAKVGLLSGAAIVIASFTMKTIELLLKRYAFHQGAEVDKTFSTIFATMQAQMVAQASGSADTPALRDTLHWLAIPEFRIGLILSTSLIVAAGYLLYASLAGAFAGYLRSRAAAR